MTTAPERLGAVELAEAYYVALSGLSRRTADRVQLLWRELDRRDLTGSWEALVGPRIVETVTAGQAAAAALADPYLSGVVAADGADPAVGSRVRPGAFAGYAADGRSLESLLYLPVVTTKQAIGAGMSDVDAMMRGLNQLLRMAASEVTDASRSATGAGITGRRTIQGYIRIATSPCCARCAILSGKEFGWNRGFQRHPRCDCVHMPATLIARGRGGRGRGLPDRPGTVTNAKDYFNSLSRRDQDRIFTIAGARAIRDGADITSVVNARRGMYTADAYRRRVAATREGTTRRGAFYRAERRRVEERTGTRFARDRIEARRGLPGFQLRTPRLLPEEIYRLAATRDEAIAMLRRFGYID
ncbi:hypothetical protein [Streptomyces pacificus]|uniref:Uncharacterized protein n=1 Tax=Streptomyces pacificus TaxID=2705029 RepID=A0A6A0AMV6_9ACTN|nr:hypothetical protein [Streptomyces pacificus]GFH34299.1 hypothetical protein SCWH03_05130 [Streptomyces pacificus]